MVVDAPWPERKYCREPKPDARGSQSASRQLARSCAASERGAGAMVMLQPRVCERGGDAHAHTARGGGKRVRS